MGWGQRELAQKGPGEVFGEMALISNDVRSETVRSVTDTVCLQIDSVYFVALLDKDPLLAQRIAKIMTRRYSSPAMSEFHQPFYLLQSRSRRRLARPPDVTTEFRSTCTLTGCACISNSEMARACGIVGRYTLEPLSNRRKSEVDGRDRLELLITASALLKNSDRIS